MMKQFLALVLFVGSFQISAQDNTALLKHFEAYYKQMQAQGDVQGMINGMTHLNILAPSEARKDTLAYIYMSEGNYVQALNTIGIERKLDDSDIAVEIKAVSLKAVKQPKLALEHFEEMFKRKPNALLAYELAELNLQTQKLDEASKHITYGLANSQDDMKKAFYEQQTPYEVPLKSAFMYLNALTVYNKDRTANIDAAVDILDAALKTAPNFNLIQLTKTELLRQKQVLQAQAAQPKQ
jgi:tetratricopeptide (TPR) repeat protein